MKVLAPFEKLFTPYILIALNLAIILAAEFAGGGTFFADTGLMHAIVVVFIGLIVLQIFTDYSFNDHILKGFLKIQIGFLFFLGLVHLYEYIGLGITSLNSRVVELSVTASYLLWFLGMLLALEFVSRIYYQRKGTLVWVLTILIALVAILITCLHVSSSLIGILPTWFPEMMLMIIVALAVAEVSSLARMRKIMPIFMDYSNYAIPAMVLLFFASLSEYFESTEALKIYGISPEQNLYISHFLIYATLSLLLIGFSKLKKPMGIYAEE